MERGKAGMDIDGGCAYTEVSGVGGEEEEEVNLHILKRAEFLIKKRLKLIYAGVCLTHCTF